MTIRTQPPGTLVLRAITELARFKALPVTDLAAGAAVVAQRLESLLPGFDIALAVERADGWQRYGSAVAPVEVEQAALNGSGWQMALLTVSQTRVNVFIKAPQKPLKADLWEALAAQIEQILIHTPVHSTNAKIATPLAATIEPAVQLDVLKEQESRRLDVSTVLVHIVEQVTYLLDMDRVSIQLLTEQPNIIEAVAVYDRAKGRASKRIIPYAISDFDVVETVLKSGEAFVSDDVQQDPRVVTSRESFVGYGYHSMILVPLDASSKRIGVMGIATVDRIVSWQPSAINLARVLATQAAAAIENARLLARLDREREEVNLLQETSATLYRGLSLDETLNTILDGVARLVSYDGAELSLYDAERNVLIGKIDRGGMMPAANHQRIYTPNQSMSGRLIQGREPVRILDLRTENVPWTTPLTFEIRSYLGVPLIVGEEIVGTLELAAIEAGAFSSEDQRLVSLIASQAAQAIVNAQRYEAVTTLVNERSAQFSALQRITVELNSTLDVNVVLKLVLEEAVRSVGATRGSIALWQAQLQKFSVILTHGYTGESQAALLAYEPGYDETPLSIVARTGEAIISPQGLRDVTARSGSGVDVPIIYQERCVGVISLRSVTRQAFEPAQLPFLHLLADQAALAIGNAAYYSEQMRQRELAQQRANLLDEVFEIGNVQRTNRPLPETLTDIAYGVVNAVGFRAVAFGLIDIDEPDVMRWVAFAGILPDAVEYMRGRPMSLDFARRLLDSRYQISQSFYLPESAVNAALEDQSENPTIRIINDDRTVDEWQAEEMLITPLYGTNDELLGVLSVDDPFDRRRPTRRTIEALEIFANQAKVAIENARLYHATERQLAEQNALNLLSQEISGLLDFRQIIRVVFNGLQAVLHFDSFFSIAYYHISVERSLIVSYDQGLWEEREDLVAESPNGIHAHMIRQRQPLLFRDLRAEQDRLPAGFAAVRFGMEEQASASWMGIPLLVTEQEVIGALSVHSYAPNMFRDRDLAFLKSVGRQVALTLQNARLFQERERRLQETNTLNQLAAEISAPMTLSQLAEALHHHISQALRANSFYLAVYDPDSDLLEFPLSIERGQAEPIATRRGLSGMTGHLMRTQQPILINNRVAETLAEQGIVGVGVMPKSFMAVPLVVGGRSIGVISTQDYDQAHAYTQQDLALFQAIATQTASGIEKARLLAERERQVAELKALSDIGKVTSSTLDIEQMFLGIYRELTRYRPVDAFLLLTFDLNSYEITRTMTVDQGVEEFLYVRRPIRPNSYTDRLIKTNEPVLIRNSQENAGATVPNRIGTGRETLSWAGVLLQNTTGEPFGVLSMQSYTADAYNERDINFLLNVAGQVALNIQNAALFVQSQDQIEQLRALDAIASVTSSTLDFQTMFMGVYEVIKAYRNAQIFLMNIYDAATDSIVQELAIDRDEVHRITEPQQVIANSLTGWILRHKQPLLINDLSQSDALAEYPGLEPVRVETSHSDDDNLSWVGVPFLDTRGNSLGILSLQDVRANHFNQRDVEFLTNVANQVALNVQNARLFGQTREQVEQLRILREMGQASATLSLGQMLRMIYAQMNAIRPLDTLMLAVYDPQTDFVLQRVTIDLDNYSESPATPLEPNSLTSWVVRHQQPLLFSDFEHELQYYPDITPVFTGKGRVPQSWLAVPLRTADGLPLGMISMQQYLPNYFGADAINFLTNVASQISLNIENAALFQKTQAQVQQLKAEAERMRLLNRVSSAASATLDLGVLLQLTVDEMATAVNADQARLILFERGRGIGVVAAERSATGAVGEMTMPLGDNPAISWMDLHHAPLLAENVQEDPNFVAMRELLQQLGVQHLLFVPLVVKNEVIGAVAIEGQERTTFDDRNIEICQTIANQVATAIENARLLDATQESVRELTTLYDISVSLNTTLNVDEVLEILANAATDILRTDYGAMLLVDRQGRMTRFAAFTSNGDPVETMPLRENAGFRAMLSSGQPMVIDDMTEVSDPNPSFLQQGVRSGLAVPIMVAGQVAGSLMVGGNEPRHWSAKDQSLLTILSSQAATTIENARLFESEQAKRQLADTLREVSQAFTASLALNEIYDLLLDQVSRVVPYHMALLLNRNSDDFGVLATRGFDQHAEAVVTKTFNRHVQTALDQLIVTRQPVVVSSTAKGQAFLADPGGVIQSWVAVPLVLSNNVIGVCALGSLTLDSYSSEQAQTVVTIANQAATAIGTAQLFETIRGFNVELEGKVAARTAELTAEKERLEAVHSITTTLTASLDSDEIALKSLELAASAVGVGRGMLLRNDAMHDALVCRAILSEEYGLQTVDQVVDLQGGGLAGWVLDHQRGVCISDVMQDPRWVQVDNFTQDVRAVVAVPLAAADVQLGVLMLTSGQVGAFTDEHLRLLGTIANEVAIAMNNAELYDLINDQAARLAEMLQLQRQEASQNRAILESVAEGVLVISDRDTIVLYNPAAEEVLRVPAGSTLGRSLDNIAQYGKTDEDHQRGLLIYAGLVDGMRMTYKEAQPQTLTLELPGQTIAATFAPVVTTDGTRMGTAAVLRDITREIEADRSKRLFISNVSHELRTPLTSVKGYVDLLLINTAGPINDVQRSFLEVVKSNTNRLNALVEDLLIISRLENGKITLSFSAFNINDMIKDLLTTLRFETERKRMQVDLELDLNLPLIEADPNRISQVLLNLLSNAHKYTRDGGLITVRSHQNQGMLQIDVQDTGVGIKREDLPKMFGRFFRTDNPLKEEAGGTGLGLSIAKSFIELHNGKMWVESVEGEGSTFSFTLPIQQPRPDLEGSEELVGLISG